MNLNPLPNSVISEADGIGFNELLLDSNFAPFIISAVCNGVRLADSKLQDKNEEDLTPLERDAKDLRDAVQSIIAKIPADDRMDYFAEAARKIREAREEKEARRAARYQLPEHKERSDDRHSDRHAFMKGLPVKYQ